MSDADFIDAEARLARFFAEDGVADRDPVFSAQVAERIARRRLRADLGGLASAATLGGLVLWGLGPSLSAAVAELSGGLAPVLLAGAVLASLYMVAGPVSRRG